MPNDEVLARSLPDTSLAVDLTIKSPEKLARAGVPVANAAAGPEFVLSVQEITNLIDTPQLFFDCNPSFGILRAIVTASLQSLLAGGIISLKGATPMRRGGCSGCAQRKLYGTILHIAEKIQNVILQAQTDPIAKEKLKWDLRQYMRRKMPQRVSEATPIAMYARLKDNTIQRIEL